MAEEASKVGKSLIPSPKLKFLSEILNKCGKALDIRYGLTFPTKVPVISVYDGVLRAILGRNSINTCPQAKKLLDSLYGDLLRLSQWFARSLGRFTQGEANEWQYREVVKHYGLLSEAHKRLSEINGDLPPMPSKDKVEKWAEEAKESLHKLNDKLFPLCKSCDVSLR